MSATHAIEEHPSELALRLEADSREELFEEAARALAEVIAGDAAATSDEGAPPHATIALRAPDRAALLVAWLNELLFRGEVGKCVFPRATVEASSDRELRARVVAALPTALRTEVKAATMHDVRVEERDGRWRARVVLDV